VVNNTPGVTAGADQVICKGNAIVLSGSGSASSYTWSPSAGLSSVNTPTTNASPTVTTSYILSATGSNGCISKDTVQVVVNPLPVANAGNDVAVCIGSSTQLNASGGISYSWSPATGLSSTSVSNPIASPTLQTQYVVTVTDNNGCSKKDSLVIAIHALPNVDAGATRNICPGGITQLGASGASQYTWTPSGSLNSSTASNPMASPATTTNYTVTGRDLNGCENFDTVSVLVGTPLAVSAGGNQTICFGEAVTLTATSSATNYTWQPSASLSNPASATTVAHPTVMTIYTVTASSPGVCPGSATVSVNVNPLPTITAPTVTNVCIGSSIVLNAGGAATYTWAPAGALSNTNTASPVFSGTTNATYTVTGTNVNNCVNFAVVNVVVNALPVIDSIISSPTDCGSTTGQLQITASGVSPFTYSITGHPNQTSSQFTGLAAATYSAQITDVNGCLAGQSIVVGSVNNVHAAFTASPSSGSYPLNVAFTNNSTGANHYNWNFGNATTATAQNASTIYNTVGTYTVALIVYNNIPSCSDTAYQTIEVLDQPKVVIPNIITPNGDGINEEFELIGYGVKSYQAAFFDRWGKKVAEVSGDAGTKWNPANLHDGTYYYVITVTTIDGKTREYHDFLTIIR
jgi:gliding motility-associated-like protein